MEGPLLEVEVGQLELGLISIALDRLRYSEDKNLTISNLEFGVLVAVQRKWDDRYREYHKILSGCSAQFRNIP